MIKLIIADDHKIFRQGISLLMSEEKDILVLGEASNESELMELLKLEIPDLILMDIDLGKSNGIDLTSQIIDNYSSVKILAFSMHDEKNYVLKMLEAGATGYLIKSAGKDEMITAIKTVAKGDGYFSQEVSTLLLRHFSKKDKGKESKTGEGLTTREIEVLKLIADEYSNTEIAEKLFISVRTVDSHRRNLLDKLGVKNTVGLVKYALQNNLIDS
jgi:DNA-binding NarL/FixJ family response regulator